MRAVMSMMNMSCAVPHHQVDILIVGGGLSGIMLAYELEKKKQKKYLVLEAKAVLGGRLLNDAVHDELDLGGAWIWPQHQPLLKELLKTLGIATIEQQPIDPYTETRRIQGGAVQIVRTLAAKVPPEKMQLESPVKSCTLDAAANQIRVETTTDVTYLANQVVFCVPPRLLLEQHGVMFDPPLSASKQRALQSSHTWMAGVTKVALVYPHCFWKSDYSSYSRMGAVPGPVFQMYDASTDHVHALTAFTVATSEDDKILAQEVAHQMSSLWKALGKMEWVDKADSYISYHVQRWPLETYMSENRNPTRIQPHPEPVLSLSTPEWEDRLFFGGTETDQKSPGVMEGAVSAALRVLRQLGLSS
jgi:monoamine oxidase